MANAMAIAGLAAVGLSVTLAVLLVISFVAGGVPAIIVGIFIACLFASLWFVLPLLRRQRAETAAPRSDGHSMHP